MTYAWWEIAIFIIGTLSFISIIAILFLPIGNGPDSFKYVGSVPEVSDPQFVRMLSDSLNMSQKKGDQITILNNGDEFLTSFLKDIDGATESINIMNFIWEEGKMSDQIFQHLDQKLNEGVPVRIMYDAFGAPLKLPKEQFKKFKDLGGKLKVFHSFTITPWELGKNHKRNHRRAITIDGKIGYTGGLAISDDWLGNARNKDEIRDMMFRSTGEMTRDIQGSFSELWASMEGEILLGHEFFPLDTQIDPKNSGTVDYSSLMSTPSPDTLTLQKFFLLSILGAKHSVHITTPYFLPDQSLREALIQKAQEGVDVRILLPSKITDSKSVYYASRYSYQELMDGGVKIYEYQPTFIHSKIMVIDGQWSVIGSANMDNRSRRLNVESVFGISNAAFGQKIEAVFKDDLSKAIQIDQNEWPKRSLWQKGREIFARKFIKQY